VVTSPLTRGAQEGRLTLGWGPHRSVPSVLASELVSAQAGVGGGRGCTTTGVGVGTTIGAGVTTGTGTALSPALAISPHAIVIGLIGITRRE
jgi:hypothetical protein